MMSLIFCLGLCGVFVLMFFVAVTIGLVIRGDEIGKDFDDDSN